MLDKNTKHETREKLEAVILKIENLREMVRDERYCLDILNELALINTSLEDVGAALVKSYLKGDFKEGIAGDEKEKHYEELIHIIYKLTK